MKFALCLFVAALLFLPNCTGPYNDRGLERLQEYVEQFDFEPPVFVSPVATPDSRPAHPVTVEE